MNRGMLNLGTARTPTMLVDNFRVSTVALRRSLNEILEYVFMSCSVAHVSPSRLRARLEAIGASAANAPLHHQPPRMAAQ